MQDQGGGGFGFVSNGMGEVLIVSVVLMMIFFTARKAYKLVWAAFN